MIVWDIWSFRNELAHGPEVLEEQETHKTLNKKVIEEYNKGSGNLLLEDKFLIDDNGLDELMTGTIHDMQACLDRLNAAKVATESTSTTIEDMSQRRITDYFRRQVLNNRDSNLPLEVLLCKFQGLNHLPIGCGGMIYRRYK